VVVVLGISVMVVIVLNYNWLPVWLSGNALASINVIYLR